MSAGSADLNVASSATVPQEDFVVLPQATGKTWRSDWIAMMIVLLVLLIPFSATFQHGATQMDEATLLVYPEMVQRGAVPFRDFETFYGPANTYLLAAVYSFSGIRIEAERMVGLFYRAVILVALFGITRRWGTGIATACMFLAGMLLLPSGVAAFAWYGALACAVCFIWAMTRANAWRCFIGGWFAATALMFRPDIGPAVILAALVLVWPLTRPQQAKFGLGVAIGLIPLAVMSCLTGPEQLFNNLFLYPVIRSAPARRIPLLTAEPTLVRLFFAQVVSAMVNIVAGVLAVRARPSGRRERALLALALLGAGIIPQAWQRLDLTHLFFVVFLIVGTLPLSIYFLLARRSEGRRRPWLVLASTATVAIFVTGLAPSLPTSDFRLFGEALRTSLAGSVSVQRGPRSFPIGSPQQVVEIGRLLDTLERLSQPGQRLFVGPADLRRTNYCDTFIYHLLPNLRPATYFLEMNPLSANRPGSRLAADILSADWLVLNRKWDLVVEPNKSAEDGSAEAAEVVPAHFHFVAQFGTFALFQRNR